MQHVLRAMLRPHSVQQWFALNDSAMVDLQHNIRSNMRLARVLLTGDSLSVEVIVLNILPVA